MSYRTVMLERVSKDFFVTQEGFEQIRSLITQYQVCKDCGELMDQADHLLIGKNWCLDCVLRNHPQLRFLGPRETDSDGDALYEFVDESGMVFISRANSSTDVQDDVVGALERLGFPVPRRHKPHKWESEVELKQGDWKYYGKLEQSVIVLRYRESDLTLEFLSYKDSTSVELTKRVPYKQLFERARQIVESSRRPNGKYYINGYEQSQIYEETLFPIIAQLESAVWDVQRQFMSTPPGYQQDTAPEEEVQPDTTKRKRYERRDRRQTKLQLVPTQENASEPMETEPGEHQIDSTRVLGTINTEEGSTE